MKKITLLFTTIFAALLISCATTTEIPEGKTAAQIIQMGQNAVTDGQYDTALCCYEEALSRFGSNPSVFAETKYEIGHVYIKQNNYEKAYETFTELLSLYDYNSSVLPASYKKLAEIGLSKIPEKKLEELKSSTVKDSE